MSLKKHFVCILISFFCVISVNAQNSIKFISSAEDNIKILKGIYNETINMNNQLGTLNYAIQQMEPCCPTIKRATSKQGLSVNPGRDEDVVLVSVKGSGSFVSLFASKQGGTNDLTFLNLTIDGELIMESSYAGMKNIGLTQQNSFGISINTSKAGIDVITIGFPQHIEFEKSLVLTAKVREDNVIQILSRVIYGQ